MSPDAAGYRERKTTSLKIFYSKIEFDKVCQQYIANSNKLLPVF